MANGYSLPSWLTPQRSPWEALVAGVQAGSAIAANRQRGRALAAQSQHQAFQDSVLNQKFQADAQDLQTLQAWWPTFSNAEGESLGSLQVPPLKNAQLWNNITVEVERKKQQSGAGQLANAFTSYTQNPSPENEAMVWSVAAKNPWIGIDKVGTQINQIKTAKRLEESAKSLAEYREGRIELGYATIDERATIAALERERRETVDAARIAQINAETNAIQERMSLRQSELDQTKRRNDLAEQRLQQSLPATVKQDLDFAAEKFFRRGYSSDKVENMKLYEAERNRLLEPHRTAPPQTAPTAPSGVTPKPVSKAEFDALPSGTRFIDPEGKERIKP